jgi:hypothetical protein
MKMPRGLRVATPPRDTTRYLHAVEDARNPRVLDATTHAPRYVCIGFGVIRL